MSKVSMECVNGPLDGETVDVDIEDGMIWVNVVSGRGLTPITPIDLDAPAFLHFVRHDRYRIGDNGKLYHDPE